ncbi:elongation factor G [Geopsychrobacter electrodiphilus]|uniref:elongation factor G n=1 Tax=Geopsychrobacter electrodiphilus TaxID=225196 RepID=UPI0003809626|nr:elongation factor G [Geopsychrobacter electrodiphilus]
MPATKLDRMRNIGIISHIDAGKTTLSERILFYSGEIHKMGEVHDGASAMDWMAQEQERGITITASATSCRWHDLQINLIDTPGHIDFTIEVERSLRALDGAIAIFSAVEGVQPQSESVWRQANHYQVPRICLINKMDRIGADYQRVMQTIAQRLNARPVLLQLPLGIEENFCGVIDILNSQQILFSNEDQGCSLQVSAANASFAAQIASHRELIVEVAADFDEMILGDFLNGQPVSNERLIAALRKGTIAGEIFPVLLGSALRNKGIQPLLDAVDQFLPSPRDCIPALGRHPEDNQSETIPCDPDGPLCALAFKVVADEGRKLTYLRIYSGSLEAGDSLLVSNRMQPEKVARLFRMHAHKRERITSASAGDIVAASGLKSVLTGDTLCRNEHPLILAGLEYPEPVVSLAVEPRGIDDREKLSLALDKLQWEDPTFRVTEDPDTGQTLLTGMGELHLEVIVQRLESDFGVQVNTGKPQVVYRETLQKQIEHRELFEHEIDGHLNQGDVLLRLTPLPRRSGVQIDLPPTLLESLTPEISVALKPEIEQTCHAGVVAGYPLTDLKVEILEIPFDPVKTTPRGILAALHLAIIQAGRKAGPTLLEPIMQLELTTPSEHTGRVMGSLQQKGGQVAGILTNADQDLIHATIPLTQMFGYMTELRSATKGSGSFTMEFSHFDQAPVETLKRFGL